MWLLPPDFPADAFDLPPGTWALPWYADERHIAALMRLLVAGEARIREWMPLPWAALENTDIDASVRPGAALVLHAPAEQNPDEIVARAQALPWPYVFWCSSRPTIEGEGAWLEREIKRILLSELHRSLLDPKHPLARFHVERLPLELVASMVGDPIDLLEIAQAAVLHRLEHANDGLRREDYEYSTRWVAGRRLGDYLSRIAEEDRSRAMVMIEQGGRGEEDRASFRRSALALQDVGLGLFVGEDLALGPLARSSTNAVVSAGVLSQLPLLRAARSSPPTMTTAISSTPLVRIWPLPATYITTPSVELAPTGMMERSRWIFNLIVPAATHDRSWQQLLSTLQLGLALPRKALETRNAIQTLATIRPRDYREQRLHELVALLFEIFSRPIIDRDLSHLRQTAAILVQAATGPGTTEPPTDWLDALIVERAILQSPSAGLLEALEIEVQSRVSQPQPLRLVATWTSISAEVARLRGHSAEALARFDAASHQWAALDFDGREGWLQARTSAAYAAYEAMQLDKAEQTLEHVVVGAEVNPQHTIHASVPLVRGLIALRRGLGELAAGQLRLAANRFHVLGDARGEAFARTALAEMLVLQENLSAEATLEEARQVFGRLVDIRGRTYAELLLGDVVCLGSRLDEARACYREAMRLTEYTGDDLARSTAYHKLARLQAQIHRYDIAIDLERQALGLERAIGHTTLAEQTERTIAEIEILAASAPAND